MGCNAGPTLNGNLVGRRTSFVPGRLHRRQVLNECWPAPAMVMEGIHVEDIFELVSLVLSLIIFWTFRIPADEEDQYTDFLPIALKQTKAGPLSSGTYFLVLYYVYFRSEKIQNLDLIFGIANSKVSTLHKLFTSAVDMGMYIYLTCLINMFKEASL